MRENFYQWTLIILLFTVSAVVGIFVYREIYPEYKIYQKAYIELEKFRSELEHSTPPDFYKEVKQIVLPREDNGPETIDRCISCHVATQIPNFSPTKLAYDINGHLQVDAQGHPVQVPNDSYIWKKVDEAIAELTDEKKNQLLKIQGETEQLKQRLAEADRLKGLKVVDVNGTPYDMTKVLAMHPLMGREVRPFQYHPLEEFGCTSCHNGNGRGLTTDKAHGPVFSGQYEEAFEGPRPLFLEPDPKNDPSFAEVYAGMPDHTLIFQTTPLFVGNVIESMCVQCHLPTDAKIEGISNTVSVVGERKDQEVAAIEKGLEQDKEALLTLIQTSQSVVLKGVPETEKEWQAQLKDPRLSEEEQAQYIARLQYLARWDKSGADLSQLKGKVLKAIQEDMEALLGSHALVQRLQDAQAGKGMDRRGIDTFLKEHRKDPQATGAIFVKLAAIEASISLNQHLNGMNKMFQSTIKTSGIVPAMVTDVDKLTRDYQRGQELFMSQACYACHRIAGYSRGGVGPELTKEGYSYPWYVKEKMMWPQFDLKTSTMPNFRLDYEELEDLMTFLMAQRGVGKTLSEVQYQIKVKSWEAGAKLPWEQPIAPDKIEDVHYGMTVFATEGCASCHKLKGFESNVGYEMEKAHPSFDALMEEKEWFKKLFPETIIGSQIVSAIEAHVEEIDRRIVNDVRSGSILEELEERDPEVIMSYYSPFKYAFRAKNHAYQEKIASDPAHKGQYLADWDAWKRRVHRVLMMFVQEYGLGRLIGPRINWSGIYRSDEWLMSHFRNPAAHSPFSIMPVFPFDDTKFYALTHTLNVLARRNRDEVREVWDHRGFNPEMAFQTYCSNCHGETRQGNGPTAEWIYPIPKNLRNAAFLRNLTKERAIESITHGVRGTPMPVWGEVAPGKNFVQDTPVLTSTQIAELVDWLFLQLPGGQVIKSDEDVLKWQYQPKDVLKELKQEKGELKSKDRPPAQTVPSSTLGFNDLKEVYYASLNPVVYADNKELDVSDLFDVEQPIVPHSSDTLSYFIKKKYYTEVNIQEGEKLFLLNCAVCHGKEGAGNGERAQSMAEAKPRMLTNMDWLRTRDDLRLLRSIKYGVPGTAMTPWGDYTSALQRIQLAIFIRTLSHDKRLRDDLLLALFHSFEESIFSLIAAQASDYVSIEKLQHEYDHAQQERRELYDKIDAGDDPTPATVDVYKKEVNLLALLKQKEGRDNLIVELINTMKQEKELYQNIGLSMIERKIHDEIFDAFIRLLEVNKQRFEWKDGKLLLTASEAQQKEIEAMGNSIVQFLEDRLDLLAKRRVIELGKLPSTERDQILASINEEKKGLIQLKGKILSGLQEAFHLREKEKILYAEYIQS